jgi:hypothetical protein
MVCLLNVTYAPPLKRTNRETRKVRKDTNSAKRLQSVEGVLVSFYHGLRHYAITHLSSKSAQYQRQEDSMELASPGYRSPSPCYPCLIRNITGRYNGQPALTVASLGLLLKNSLSTA